MQVWELEASLDAKKAVCDRLERQLQLSANQMQRQHDAEERYGEAQRRLRSAESSIQELQAELQVRLLPVKITSSTKARQEQTRRYQWLSWRQAFGQLTLPREDGKQQDMLVMA